MLFLDAWTIYRDIQRELPEGAYPDGSPSGYFSTADSFATAEVFADIYTAASGSYQEFFPATSTRLIDKWVFAYFGTMFDSTVDVPTKQQRVLAKAQKIGSLSNWALLTLVLGYLPQGTFARIYKLCPNSGGGYGWSLGVSLLGDDTFLALGLAGSLGLPPGIDQGDQWCSFISNLHWSLGVDELGVETFLTGFSSSEIATLQNFAYQYQVLIFNQGNPLSADTLQQLDADLSANEPARSGHIIVQGLDIATSGLNTVVPNVNQMSAIDCAAVDPTSTQTGYTGRTA